MVEPLLIRDKYNQLLELIEIEAEKNILIREYYNYMNEYKWKFMEKDILSGSDDLREFLRGANRYSDEFDFSDENRLAIKKLTNTIYELLL